MSKAVLDTQGNDEEVGKLTDGFHLIIDAYNYPSTGLDINCIGA